MSDQKKIGILWGGGLGDLLVIRPLLTGLHADRSSDSYFLTTASHATELFNEFCAPTTVVQLPRSAGGLLPVVKKWGGFFDLLYLGPYPTLKTRLLALLLRPAEIRSRVHGSAGPFILEQVLADCADLGLGQQAHRERTDFRSFLPWPVVPPGQPFAGTGPFLVLHAGSKLQWQTTRWPEENWATLAGRLLKETSCNLVFVGTAAEEPRIRRITAALPQQQRIAVRLSQTLQDTAALLAAAGGVICHNSGILHLATFLGKKTVCITGSSAPYWQPPYPWVKNITSGACTRACNRYVCPVPFYRAKCIKSITVAAVWQAITGLGLLEHDTKISGAGAGL